MLYIDWREYLISNKDDFNDSEQQRAIGALETNPIFFPENIEKREGTPFYNFIFKGYDKAFKGTGLRFAELQEGKDMKEDGLEIESFMHVYGWKLNGAKRKNEEARLYMNLMAKNIPTFVKGFYTKCKKTNLPFYFKFDNKDARNDPFLIYCSYEDLASYISILEQMRNEQPELFEGTDLISNNLGRIYDYIGYADEPNIENESANSIREKIVKETKSEVLSRIKEKLGEPDSNAGMIIENPPLSFEELKTKIVKEYIEKEYFAPNAEFFKDKEDNKGKVLKIISEGIDKAILTGTSINSIALPNNWPNLNIEQFNWLEEFKKVISKEKNLQNNTVLRAYLARYRYFQSPTVFNEQEKKLNKITMQY